MWSSLSGAGWCSTTRRRPHGRLSTARCTASRCATARSGLPEDPASSTVASAPTWSRSEVRVVCFTSISFGYLARARVLATTLKHHHPEWEFCVCITDREPPGFTFDLKREPFDEMIWGDELPVPDIEAWLFRHELVEACTAVKGTVLDLMLRD